MKRFLKPVRLLQPTAAIAVTAMIFFVYSAGVGAAPAEDAPLECLRCHTRVLKDHDKLGSGSEACWACHHGSKIGLLQLPDGTQLPLAESNQLCKECHSDRYKAWEKGKHGIPGKEMPEALTAKKSKCVGCHSPHQPKIKLSKGTGISAIATPKLEGLSDCLNCHVRVLEGHDKLGQGSKACWACHYNMEMGVLHLRLSLKSPVAVGGERLKLSDYPRLCAQCHQTRYEDWLAGTHGIPAWEVGVVNIHGLLRVGCIGCHDPHQPQVSFSNITLPHPPPQTPVPPTSPILLTLFGVAALLALGVGVSVVKKGEWP